MTFFRNNTELDLGSVEYDDGRYNDPSYHAETDQLLQNDGDDYNLVDDFSEAADDNDGLVEHLDTLDPTSAEYEECLNKMAEYTNAVHIAPPQQLRR